MQFQLFSEAERLLAQTFPSGAEADVSDLESRQVRADFLRHLLLAGDTDKQFQPRLALFGAVIVGSLDLSYAQVQTPIQLRNCDFTDLISLYGARLGHVSFRGSEFPGIVASYSAIDGSLGLRECRSTATIHLIGTTINGSLLLDGAQLSSDDVALSGTKLTVGVDIKANNGFACRGELRLNDAEVGGSLRWEGAHLHNPGRRALFAPDIKIGAVANLCEGFKAEGAIFLGYANVGSRLCFENAHLSGPAPDSRLVRLGYLHAADLVLATSNRIAGEVDLSYAQIGVLRDDPSTWPTGLRLSGLRYDALSGIETGVDRLPWLRRDPNGYQPQPYEQLAEVYRQWGRDAEARAVLLAKQRHRRQSLRPMAKVWGWIQDLSIGYGYRPGRAVILMAALLAVGSIAFSLNPPIATDPSQIRPFVAPIYTLDLLVPLADLGQQQSFQPTGAAQWLAYGLVASGWVLATTIAAGIARVLRRD